MLVDQYCFTSRNPSQLVMIVKINIGEINVLLLRKLAILAIPGVDLSNLGNLSTLDRIGAALAIAQVSQELIDPIIAEGPSQCGVFHLLVAKKRDCPS